MHADSFGLELPRRHDEDAAFPAAQIVEGFARLEVRGFEHLFDHRFRAGEIRRQYVRITETLCVQGRGAEEKSGLRDDSKGRKRAYYRLKTHSSYYTPPVPN